MPGELAGGRVAAAPAAASARRASALKVILTAGLVAGALDLLYVLVLYGGQGVPPIRILHGIAAGLVGREAASQGGLATAALGIALHFIIALGAAAAFYLGSRVWRVLLERPWISGLLFGAAVWLFMNCLVLPFSATPPRAFPPPQWVPIFVAHLVCVGLPIAWIVRRGAGGLVPTRPTGN